MQTSFARHADLARGVATKVFVGDVDDCGAARLLEQAQLVDGQTHVVEDTVNAGAVEAEVDENVLVRQRDAEVFGLDRPKNRTDPQTTCRSRLRAAVARGRMSYRAAHSP